jgi:hypothetical protein
VLHDACLAFVDIFATIVTMTTVVTPVRLTTVLPLVTAESATSKQSSTMRVMMSLPQSGIIETIEKTSTKEQSSLMEGTTYPISTTIEKLMVSSSTRELQSTIQVKLVPSLSARTELLAAETVTTMRTSKPSEVTLETEEILTTLHVSRLPSPTSVTYLQPLDPCQINNGNCSDTCNSLVSGSPVQCSCPLGKKLLADNNTCEGGHMFLVFLCYLYHGSEQHRSKFSLLYRVCVSVMIYHEVLSLIDLYL